MNGRRFAGWTLVVIGGLLALLTGGCTLYQAIQDFMGYYRSEIGPIYIFGCVPFVIGVAIVWIGFVLLKPTHSARREDMNSWEIEKQEETRVSFKKSGEGDDS